MTRLMNQKEAHGHRILRPEKLGAQGSWAEGARSHTDHSSRAVCIPRELHGAKRLLVRQLCDVMCCEKAPARLEEYTVLESWYLPGGIWVERQREPSTWWESGGKLASS